MSIHDKIFVRVSGRCYWGRCLDASHAANPPSLTLNVLQPGSLFLGRNLYRKEFKANKTSVEETYCKS